MNNFSEMPKSKWTKTAMLDAIAGFLKDYDIQDNAIVFFNKLSKNDLFDCFFEWKNAGLVKAVNEQEFYGLDNVAIASILIDSGYGLETFSSFEDEYIKTKAIDKLNENLLDDEIYNMQVQSVSNDEFSELVADAEYNAAVQAEFLNESNKLDDRNAIASEITSNEHENDKTRDER